MAENHTGSEYNKPVIPGSTAPVEVPAYGELQSREKLATTILDDNFDYFEHPDTGENVRRIHWESDNGAFTHTLFEFPYSIGFYYSLNTTELGVQGDKWYNFIGDSIIGYLHKHPSSDEQPVPITQLKHEITRHLREKYRKTQRGQEAERYAESALAATALHIAITDIVETLQSNDGFLETRALRKIESPDPRHREDGLKEFYELSVKSSIFHADETTFRQAFPHALEIFHQPNTQGSDDVSHDTIEMRVIRENPGPSESS